VQIGVIEDQDPSISAPLFTQIQTFAANLGSRGGLSRAPYLLNELATSAWRADKFYRPPQQHISLFRAALARLNDLLGSVRGEWTKEAGGDSGVIPVDQTTEFYRVWSALQFVYCLPTGQNELSIQELFGDGLQWAGCTIMHLLHQVHRFEVSLPLPPPPRPGK
jgi:cytoplasmic FMR1 interacting protein